MSALEARLLTAMFDALEGTTRAPASGPHRPALILPCGHELGMCPVDTMAYETCGDVEAEAALGIIAAVPVTHQIDERVICDDPAKGYCVRCGEAITDIDWAAACPGRRET